MMSVMSMSVGSILSWLGLNLSWVMMSVSGGMMLLSLEIMGMGEGLGSSGGWWGCDFLSGMLVWLSLWICLLVLMASGINLLVLVIMGCLCWCFFSMDFLSFYLFFELVLVPMFLLIIFKGDYSERVESGVYMLFYTVFGSLPLLVMVMKIGSLLGSWSFMLMFLEKLKLSGIESWSILLAFLIKLPMYGVHIWLPKAHVEAPVGGSSILAGILLKLGGYGILRSLCYLCSGASFKGMLISLGLYGGLLCGVMCFRQLDMKKLVAYSSVVHMGLMLSGSVGYNMSGNAGAVSMMVAHGLCSSGLFYYVNILYGWSNSRSFLIVKGVVGSDSWMMMWGFLLVAANSAAPPFLNIFSEVLLGMSVISSGWGWSMILGLMFFVSVGFGIYFYSILCHGEVSLSVGGGVKVNEYMLMGLHFFPVILVIFKMEMFL